MFIILKDFQHFQVTVESLCSKQVEKEVEVRGPPVSKAFDDQGNPTKVNVFSSFNILEHKEFQFFFSMMIVIT